MPIEIRMDGKELPAGSDRALESYYVQAPRVGYLPLLIPDIKRHLAELVLDDSGAKFLKEEDWWFEAEGGVLMKWSAPPAHAGGSPLTMAQALALRLAVRPLLDLRLARRRVLVLTRRELPALPPHAAPRSPARRQAASRPKHRRVQAGLHGPAQRSRLPALGQHEARYRPAQTRARRSLGRRARPYVPSLPVSSAKTMIV